MTALVFTNNYGVNVEYKTDLLKGNSGIFTIMQINDLTAPDNGRFINNLPKTEQAKGLDFKQVQSDLKSFEDFAEIHSLKLTRIDSDGEKIVIVDYSDESGSQSIILF